MTAFVLRIILLTLIVFAYGHLFPLMDVQNFTDVLLFVLIVTLVSHITHLFTSILTMLMVPFFFLLMASFNIKPDMGKYFGSSLIILLFLFNLITILITDYYMDGIGIGTLWHTILFCIIYTILDFYLRSILQKRAKPTEES